MFNGEYVYYDADGNMTSCSFKCCERTAFAYDSANRLIKAENHSYTYNAENTRIKCRYDNEEITYTHNTNCKISQLLYVDQNGTVTKYVYGIGLIGEESADSFKTYHFDYRGSTVAITDINGNITDTFSYDTYGDLVSHMGSSDAIFLYNGRDGVITDKNGLLYMRARYYSPKLRRFINADILHGEIADSTSLNRYSYVNGNPVSFVDPLGLSAISWLLDFIGNIDNHAEYYESLEQSAIESAIAIGNRATITGDSISIDMVAEEQKIDKIIGYLGLQKVCDLISAAACDKFFKENDREFILSDACVSKEIYDHIEAYYWSVGKTKKPNYLAWGYSLNLSLNKLKNGDFKSLDSEYNADSVYSATKSIDMKEIDIKNVDDYSFIDRISSQSFLFGYKEGIRQEYIGTEYDPWADERK